MWIFYAHISLLSSNMATVFFALLQEYKNLSCLKFPSR